VDGRVASSDVVRGDLRYFTGTSIFKGPTERRLYKSFGVKGLIFNLVCWLYFLVT
jgi:hypothetical protein